MENNVYKVINQNSENRFILTCEHASSLIPDEYDNLGLSPTDLDSHIARDKGCKEVTEKLAERLGCFAILGGYSRLLIDLNRGPEEQELIVPISDGVSVPQNNNLSASEREQRIQKYYIPYYRQIEKQISFMRTKGIKPILFSIHSFTPQLKGGAYRPWHAGILYHNPQKFAEYMLSALKEKKQKVVGENVPYDLRKYNTGVAVLIGEKNNIDYSLIEIRDDEFLNLEKGAEFWSDVLYEILTSYQTNG